MVQAEIGTAYSTLVLGQVLQSVIPMSSTESRAMKPEFQPHSSSKDAPDFSTIWGKLWAWVTGTGVVLCLPERDGCAIEHRTRNR